MRMIDSEEDPRLRIISRHKYSRKKRSKNDHADSAQGKPEAAFKLRVHRRLHPILDRIKIPEPQPFIPDAFQLEALEASKESDVLVTAPTGSGKTYIAIKAIERVFKAGGKSWYASPLKALSNAKYGEFSQIFGSDNVGILTGDRKEKPHAPIIVGTTEILRNQLYDTMQRGEDLEEDLVVLDEAHYLGDKDRGVVWEEVLIYLPSRVRLLLLSATIQNADEICSWLEWLREGPCVRVISYERPVPLFPLFLFPSGELTPLSTRRGLFPKIRTLDPKSFSRHDFPDIPKLMEVLRKTNLLPAIFFLKSRADCEKAISMCHPTSGSHNGRQDSRAFYSRLHELLEEFPFLRRHQHLGILKKARVGAHHGGQLPHWKLFLERLMQEGQLDAIFSTSTVAAGVNFPARTVVVFQSDRFNGKEFVELSANELLQMTGRAGRRGMDEIGFVLVSPGPHQDAQLIHDLLRSPPDSIDSQIRVNFSMVLNLLLSHTPEEIRALFASSFATYQNLSKESEINKEFQAVQRELHQWLPETACGTLERLTEVRPRFSQLSEQFKRARRDFRRQTSLSTFNGQLVPGRTFRNRRGTPFVAVDHPQSEQATVAAVRLAFPLHFRRGRIRIYKVPLHRIRQLGEVLDILPPLNDRGEWQTLVSQHSAHLFVPVAGEHVAENSFHAEAATQEIAQLALQKASLPCERCALFAPCQRSTSHPFSHVLQQYLEQHAHVHTIQEELWRSFLQHYHFLQEEGYVDREGRLTADGLWASKLRLDQPLLISECIRKSVLPSDNPELLAALIAPFVMDRDRPGDIQLSGLIWKYPDLAKPFFSMLQNLQMLRRHLNAAGFTMPPMPFWAVITVYHWALGRTWEEVKELSGMAEGDLAMVILRTADHLRQIESLSETHPGLAASANQAIQMILREPVLVT